jgi:hypothetical protein
MRKIYKKIKFLFSIKKAFVLPFTLLICAIMILITVSISTILTKQIYFSILAKDSQLAYYAADDAVACILSIETLYSTSTGIFQSDPNIPDTDTALTYMTDIVTEVNANRESNSLPSLALSPSLITCAQSQIFSVSPPTNFYVGPEVYVRQLSGGGTDEGKTSTLYMRMDLGDGTYRCAKVTVNKTESYRQVIAQGYSRCDSGPGVIERAVINVTQ